ncbi:exodeoxyribonuclease V, gamma subunit domain protein, partial [Leptospira interrogans serovar Copenhageni str. LT2050]
KLNFRFFLESIPRAFSLSAKLTSLYKDYELNRSSWIQSWANEKGLDIPSISHRPTPFPKEDEYYLFQKKLYQKVFLNSNQPSTLIQFFSKKFLKTLGVPLKILYIFFVFLILQIHI